MISFGNITKKQNERGFTLVELFIVITIFSVMASVVIFKFRDFNKSATLDNLAQDVALRVVEAQKTAISGVLISPGTGSTAPVYGVYFSNSPTGTTYNYKKFVYFTDLPNVPSLGLPDFFYNLSVTTPVSRCGATFGTECLAVTTISTGDNVNNLCSVNSAGTYGCLATTGTGSSAHVTFQRPFPAAHIRTCVGVTCASTDSQKLYVELVSGSDATLKKTIVITNLGQVKVFNGPVTKACFADGFSIPGVCF